MRGGSLLESIEEFYEQLLVGNGKREFFYTVSSVVDVKDVWRKAFIIEVP